MIRVVIADDADAILQRVKILLDGDSRFRVVGESRTYTETKSLVENLRPDVLVVDLRMPGANSESISLVKLASSCECPVVAMSFSVDEKLRRHAKGLGADRLLDKIHLHETLIPTLEDVVPRHK